MLSYIPINRKNVQEIVKQGDIFLVNYADGSTEILSSPIEVKAEKNSLGGDQWFWAIESTNIPYWNGQIELGRKNG